MGICRQLKDEIFHCPPVIVLIGRRDDRWLATWSRADAVIAYPLDPIRVAASVAGSVFAAARRDEPVTIEFSWPRCCPRCCGRRTADR